MANRLPVVFEDSQGNIISNDPIYMAQKTLFEAGQGEDPDIAIRAAQKASGKKSAKAAPAATPEPEESDDDEVIDNGSEDEEPAEDYKSYKGQALTDLAKERGVELTKGITAGEVRAALIAQDSETSDSDDESEDDTQE